MYIVVHYPLFASRISGTKGQGCQTISPLWPDVSARQSWRKSQISPSRHKAARMPRCSSSRSPGRQVSRRSRAGRTSSNPGSGAGMTAGTGTRGRAGIPRASTTMSGGIAPRSRNRRSPLNPVGKRRISMQKRTNPGTTVPPSSADTTGGAGPRRRSSKSGPTISTASNCCLAPSFLPDPVLNPAGRAHQPLLLPAPRYFPCPARSPGAPLRTLLRPRHRPARPGSCKRLHRRRLPECSWASGSR